MNLIVIIQFLLLFFVSFLHSLYLYSPIIALIVHACMFIFTPVLFCGRAEYNIFFLIPRANFRFCLVRSMARFYTQHAL